ncbi:MAG TPA: phosphoribosylaminoimidazolesuccinocarboxamide synthase [Candidatus Paceibacterota bacterium]|nr:phosphoribosylaminoimidazolesuccinocarboxamide synthase [Verrucomicrobiota bacterium]HSA09798.1 phosphoribosylaminoimidazolesuccinocarboxamide synthase [Candidatus Paceibacterota bacterium]
MTEQNLVYRGKSKDVFNITEGPHVGKYRFVFTDKATGYIENGRTVFDPGYDTVVGEIPGKGAIACRFATHFFKLLKQKGVATHYIETVNENEMIVEPAIPLSMQAEAPQFPGSAPLLNLEFTWRNNATGSFWRRYPFVAPCKNLHKVVEVWTKGDSDLLITLEALAATGALTRNEIAQSVELVKDIAEIVSQEFTSKNLHVIDGKFELGRLKFGDGRIVLIDEISPDVLRVCRGFQPDPAGNCTVFDQCAVANYSEGKRTIKNRKQVSAAEFINIFL